MTIRAQVGWALCGTVAFSLAVGLAFSVLAVREALAQAAQRQHEHQARLLASVAAVEAPADRLAPFMSVLGSGPAVRYAYLAEPEGKVRLHSDPAWAGRGVAELASPRDLAARPVAAKARAGGRVYDAVVGVSPELERNLLGSALRDLAPSYARIGALGLAGGALIAWALSLVLARPVVALEEAARRLGEGDFTARVDESSGNELGQLARQFNAMAATLGAIETVREERVSHVSHDVRSPLAAVEMLTDFLLNHDADAGRLSEDQRAKLTTIQDSVRRLRVFAANLLDAAKIRSGKMAYRLVPVDLAPLARRAVELYDAPAKHRSVKLSADVPQGLKATADPERLEQALANLVSNALKYTGQGGSIAIAARRTAKGVSLEVKDDGAGMTAEQKAKLFKRFEAGPGPEGSALPSAGLGLYVVKESLAGMGGSIEVESEPGRGSVFRMELPA